MNPVVQTAKDTLEQMINSLGLSPESDCVSFNVIATDEDREEDPEHWVGMHYVYHTDQTPSTRLQIVFGHKDLKLFPVLSDTMGLISPMGLTEFRRDHISELDDHPDLIVKPQVQSVALELHRLGYELRVIPWYHELTQLEDRDQFAGMTGLFFPIFHFRHSETDDTVIIRVEPIIEQHRHQDL